MTTIDTATDDISKSICFYRDRLGFALELYPDADEATLTKHGTRVRLSPEAEHRPPDAISGAMPKHCLRVECEDLDDLLRALRMEGVRIRGDVTSARTERRATVIDPAGNPVELFEPVR